MLYLQNSAGRSAQELFEDAFEYDFEIKSRAWKMWKPVLDQIPSDSRCLFIGRQQGDLCLLLAASGFELDVLLLENDTPSLLQEKLEKHEALENVRFLDLEAFHNLEDKHALLFLQNALSCVGAGALKMQTKLSLGNIYKAIDDGTPILIYEELKGAWIHQHWTSRTKTDIPINEMATLDDFQELVDASAEHHLKTAGFLSAFFGKKPKTPLAKLIKKSEGFDHLDFILPKRWKHAAFGYLKK
ncbi:MAG: hypothetical protein P8H98_07900 [Flavobacteriales bacterium]|nr:hypothetical protein [Flavobacteriales bacterium]